MSLRVPPVLMVVICSAVSWGLALLLPAMNFEGSWRFICALCFLLVAFVILVVAVRSFVLARTTVNPLTPNDTQNLVTTGLYHYSRNPMYVAMASILIGLAFIIGNIASFAGVALFCWAITNFQIKPEERILQEQFGQAFLDYRRKKRRWI